MLTHSVATTSTLSQLAPRGEQFLDERRRLLFQAVLESLKGRQRLLADADDFAGAQLDAGIERNLGEVVDRSQVGEDTSR